MRPRVCAAIVREGQVLMVRHAHAGRNYWTLPGGGVEPGETHAQAVLREVREETHLEGRVGRFLFEEPYPAGICYCYAVEVAEGQTARLGHDPEEQAMPAEHRMLRDLAWHSLASMRRDSQVARVIAVLGLNV